MLMIYGLNLKNLFDETAGKYLFKETLDCISRNNLTLAFFTVKSYNLNTDVDHCFHHYNTKQLLNTYNVNLIIHINIEQSLYFLSGC